MVPGRARSCGDLQLKPPLPGEMLSYFNRDEITIGWFEALATNIPLMIAEGSQDLALDFDYSAVVIRDPVCTPSRCT